MDPNGVGKHDDSTHQEFIGLVFMVTIYFPRKAAKPQSRNATSGAMGRSKMSVFEAMGRPKIQQAYRPGAWGGALIFGGFFGESNTVKTEASGKLKQSLQAWGANWQKR